MQASKVTVSEDTLKNAQAMSQKEIKESRTRKVLKYVKENRGKRMTGEDFMKITGHNTQGRAVEFVKKHMVEKGKLKRANFKKSRRYYTYWLSDENPPTNIDESTIYPEFKKSNHIQREENDTTLIENNNQTYRSLNINQSNSEQVTTINSSESKLVKWTEQKAKDFFWEREGNDDDIKSFVDWLKEGDIKQ